MWALALLAYLLILFVQFSCAFIKCCPSGYAFGDDRECVIFMGGDNNDIFKEMAHGNETDSVQTCYRSGEVAGDLEDDESGWSRNTTEVEKCMDVDHRNGTVLTRTCPIDWRDKSELCDGIFKPVHYWGASIVVFANVAYVFPYFIIVLFFLAVPDLRNRAYDKAVMSYNTSQLSIASIIVGMGYFVLCHKPITPVWMYIVLGLSLQFLLTATVFWLNVICFDMTLVITRFRWIPGSDITGSEDKRKFRMYAAYAWGGAAIITAITCFVELCPCVPMSSPLKPNFERFDDGANYAVIFHVTVVPLLTLVLNNALFIYTTYKVVKMGRSTAIATENNKNVRKRYFVFLRLYILMDAPWVVAVVAAVYPDLWILKFYRMVQPTLMLLAILPKKKFYRAITCTKAPVTKTELRKRSDGCQTRC